MKLGIEVGFGTGHIVLDRDPAPPKGAQPPFSALVHCGQIDGWIKMPLGMEVDLGPGDIVLDGDPAPYPKKWGIAPPHFSAYVYCGQIDGWIKMPLGTEVVLGRGHIVLDGDTAHQKSGTAVELRVILNSRGEVAVKDRKE